MYHPYIEQLVTTNKKAVSIDNTVVIRSQSINHQSVNHPADHASVSTAAGQPTTINTGFVSKTNMYSLAHLTSEILALVCAYLELKFKCRTFPVLSHELKTAFKPALCCRGHLKIGRFKARNKSPASERALALASHFQYASSIDMVEFMPSLDFAKAPSVTEQIYTLLRAAFGSGVLNSLSIQDWSADMNDALQRLSPHELRNFRTLKISEMSYRRNAYDWGCLWRCTSLETLVVLSVDMNANCSGDVSLMDNLPKSVTSFSIHGARDSFWWEVGQKLKDPTVLPKLRFLDGGHLSQDECDGMDGLATVIPETGRSRPIECLEIRKWIPLDWAWSVQTIHLDLTNGDSCIELLSEVADSVLPALRELIFTDYQDKGRDLSPLFIFAAKRPIDQLTLAGASRKDVEPLSSDAIRALCSMSRLRSLELLIEFDGADMLKRDLQLDDDFPANCWPLLTDLKLHPSICTEQNKARFRRAAPGASICTEQHNARFRRSALGGNVSNSLKSHHYCARMPHYQYRG